MPRQLDLTEQDKLELRRFGRGQMATLDRLVHQSYQDGWRDGQADPMHIGAVGQAAVDATVKELARQGRVLPAGAGAVQRTVVRDASGKISGTVEESVVLNDSAS